MSKEIVERGASGLLTHVFIPDTASTTGGGKTGLTSASAGLKVVVIRPGEAAATKYLQSASNIEAVATIGTYAAPTAGKCRFGEIDATDLPGLYELQFADALFNATNSRRSLGGMISGATGVVPTPFQIQLADPVRGVASPTALPNAAAEAAGGLITRGTGTGQISVTGGVAQANVAAILGDVASATLLQFNLQTTLIGNVSDATPAVGNFDGDSLLSSSNDFYNGSVLAFRTGALAGIARKITVYTGATRTLVFDDPFPAAPADTDQFLILGRID